MHYERIHIGFPVRQVRLKNRPAQPAKSPEVLEAELAAVRKQEAAALRGLAQSVADTVAEHEARRQQSLLEFQMVAVELAMAAASHVVGLALQADQFAAEALIQQAVDKLGLGKALVVTLNPADLELLKRTLAETPPDWSRGVGLRGDPAVPRGGCRVEGGDNTVLISRLEDRLEEIRQVWLEGLNDAQVERRRHAEGDQALRRFPDRRDTA